MAHRSRTHLQSVTLLTPKSRSWAGDEEDGQGTRRKKERAPGVADQKQKAKTGIVIQGEEIKERGTWREAPVAW